MTTGRLWVVGLGPGDQALMPPLTWDILRQADVIVGYSGYFVGLDALKDKEHISLPLGQERERAAIAVERARKGQAVAVISSGDPGIYGMASIVLETLQQHDDASAVAVAVIPGISAVNAAASLLGAPLGHDFAVISLSDLLTPWPLIERRLRAAAEADFVIVLMNPRSRERTWQLDRAVEIIGHTRSLKTPSGIVRNAYRPEQTVAVTTLGQLPQSDVDMFTTVIIGNSATRASGSLLITPRGYLPTFPVPAPASDLPFIQPPSPAVLRERGEGGEGAGGCHERQSLQGACPPSPQPSPPGVPGGEGAIRGPATDNNSGPRVGIPAPQEILAESFRIIDQAVGRHGFSDSEWPVVRRMIHAGGDLDIAHMAVFRHDAVNKAIAALRSGSRLVTDISMVAAGINKKLLRKAGIDLDCFIDDPDVCRSVGENGGTRSYWGMAKALAEIGPAIYVVGSSPTALWAISEAVRQQRVRPNLVVAMPVGFVAVEESKEEILSLEVPVIAIRGRRGGSGIAAAAVNALLQLAFGEDSP